MKELTSGKPIKLITGFALPVLLGLAFQQAYTLTDTRGHFIPRLNCMTRFMIWCMTLRICRKARC